MASEARLKIFEIKKINTFHVNNDSPNIFPMLVNFSLYMSEPNSLCFPCLAKVRTKFPAFPVFPVPWPPCQSYHSVPFFVVDPFELALPVLLLTVSCSEFLPVCDVMIVAFPTGTLGMLPFRRLWVFLESSLFVDNGGDLLLLSCTTYPVKINSKSLQILNI